MVEVKIGRSLRKKPVENAKVGDLEWYRAKKAGEPGVFIVFTIGNKAVYFGTDSCYGEGNQIGHDDIAIVKNGSIILLEKISDRIKITIEEDDC